METDLSKGGENWGHISVRRVSQGIEVYAKLDKRVEELIQSAAEGQGTYTTDIASYGRAWKPIEPTPTLKAYNLEKSLDTGTYTLGAICGPIKDAKNRTNLSFLTFVGIGSEVGVRFVILGPAQAESVKEYSRNVVRDITYFLREYLIPVNIGINITVTNAF